MIREDSKKVETRSRVHGATILENVYFLLLDGWSRLKTTKKKIFGRKHVYKMENLISLVIKGLFSHISCIESLIVMAT